MLNSFCFLTQIIFCQQKQYFFVSNQNVNILFGILEEQTGLKKPKLEKRLFSKLYAEKMLKNAIPDRLFRPKFKILFLKTVHVSKFYSPFIYEYESFFTYFDSWLTFRHCVGLPKINKRIAG